MRDSPGSGRRRESSSSKGTGGKEQDRLVLACELFERGFAEGRVEAAVKRFSTLAGALQWLVPGSATPTRASAGSSSSSSRGPLSPVSPAALSSAANPVVPPPAPTATPARRHSRKRPLSDGHAAEDGGLEARKKKRQSQEGKEASQSAGTSSAAGAPAGSSAGSAPEATPEPQGLQLSQEVEECTLCFLEVPAGQALRLSCRHGWYCVHCMVKHAEARLDSGQVDIMCPQCRVSIPEFDLKEVLPADIRERMQARSLAQAVSKTSDLRHCPTPDCPMVVALEEGGQERFKCPLCRRASCLKCGVQPYHRGMTCEQYAERKSSKADQSFVNWMKETGTPQCPTCGMAVTKQNLDRQSTQYQECHKMMCRSCGTKFCFKCVQVLTDKFSCGCSAAAHQFIDPMTSRLVPHLKKSAAKGRGKSRPRPQQQVASQVAGRGRGRR